MKCNAKGKYKNLANCLISGTEANSPITLLLCTNYDGLNFLSKYTTLVVKSPPSVMHHVL